MSLQQGVNQILNTTMIGMRLGPNYERKAELRSLQREGEAQAKLANAIDVDKERSDFDELVNRRLTRDVSSDLARMSYRKAQLNPSEKNIMKAERNAQLAMQSAKSYYDFKKWYGDFFKENFKKGEM